jgi:signal transduction histidine kinase
MAGEEAGSAELREQIARLEGELAAAQRTAERLATSVEQFASELAHDLKNPLGAMRVNVQALKRSLQNGKALSPNTIIERLERLERAIDQALEHVADGRRKLDDAAAPAARLRRQRVDLASLLRRQVQDLAAEVGEQRIVLDCQCSELVGSWDPGRVGEVVAELLRNALKFSAHEGRVRVALRHDRASDVAELAVSDDGIGIPAHDLAHVCERFYRGENVVGRYKGAGLGLFEAQRCALDHGGSLIVVSQEGRGSMVTLRLPCN